MNEILRELRASPRVYHRVALVCDAPLEAGRAVLHTVSLNDGGALVYSDRPFNKGDQLRLANRESGQIALFRVIWRAGDEGRLHRMGITFVEPCPGYWGEAYPRDSAGRKA